MINIQCLLLLSLTILTTSETTRYFNGHQVLRIRPSSGPVLKFLQDLYSGNGGDGANNLLDFWSPPTHPGSPVDIALGPKQSAFLQQSLLKRFGIVPTVLIQDLQALIDKSEKDRTRHEGKMSWDAYHPLSTIYNWIDSLEADYPSDVKLIDIGRSTEKRALKVIKLSLNTTNGANAVATKPAIWIDGGIHAREWVTPATVTYITNQLLQCSRTSQLNPTETKSSSICELVEKFDWYIMPVANPDGYVHSWTMNRMWRKTRSRPLFSESSNHSTFWEQTLGRCVGVDPNRNFNHSWGGKGTSGNRCSDIYRGPSAASEPEVAAVQDFIWTIKSELKLFLTIHSYSQMILIPWSYDNVVPEDFSELKKVALKATAAIEALYGTKFRADPPPKLLGTAAGNSMDWAKGVAGVKYAYGLELRDTGEHGFLLPAEQILPTAEETFAGIRSMAEDIAVIYSNNNLRTL